MLEAVPRPLLGGGRRDASDPLVLRSVIGKHHIPVATWKIAARDGFDALEWSSRGQSVEACPCGIALFAAQEAANGMGDPVPTGRGASRYFVLALPPRVLPMRESRGVRLSPCDRPAAPVAVPVSSWLSRCRHAGLIVVGVTLAGCALSEDPGQLGIDPGRYEFYHCNDLAAQLKALQARENDLRSLMAKASEGGGGAVIGALSYRADYETVRSQERLLQRTAAEKKCEVAPPTVPSDQTVR
jgi:hypothetical protein